MAHPFDPSEIGGAILEQLSGILEDDITNYVAFSRRQTTLLAKQAAWITEAWLAGEIDDDDRSWFLNTLKEQSENFVRTVVGLTMITIEKAWNAVVSTLWAAINQAISAAGAGIVLPVPRAPLP